MTVDVVMTQRTMYAPFLTYYFSISRKKYGQKSRKAFKIKARQTKVMNCGTSGMKIDSKKGMNGQKKLANKL